MKTSDIKGIIPPVITPMNNDDEQTVNHEALRQQVERLLAGGVHGMFPLGTNGEAYALSFKEKEEILATVIDQVKGRVPVYAGTGCITTAETIRMSKRAEEMGADALSIITPSFALASQKELYDHYVACLLYTSACPRGRGPGRRRNPPWAGCSPRHWSR